jgi:hypothetical protein
MPQVAVEELRLIVENRPMGGNGGPTLRVLAGEGGRELLRFDCFSREAHWHIDPDGRDERDDLSNGSAGVDFALHQLTERIDELLASAGHRRAQPLAHSGAWMMAVQRVARWMRESTR